MAQILHEDIRLGVSTVNTDFKRYGLALAIVSKIKVTNYTMFCFPIIRILNVDYLTITYQVYDEQVCIELMTGNCNMLPAVVAFATMKLFIEFYFIV